MMPRTAARTIAPTASRRPRPRPAPRSRPACWPSPAPRAPRSTARRRPPLPRAAGAGPRRRGLPYLRSVDRMFLPGELQRHGLALNLSLFAANCFELDLRATDFQVAPLAVPVLLAAATRQTESAFAAFATHDGYHALSIPVGEARFGVGIQFGMIADIVQFDEIAFYRVADIHRANRAAPRALAAAVVHDAMTPIAEALWQCGDASLLFVPPPAMNEPEPLMLSVVVRPVVPRARVALGAVAKAQRALYRPCPRE